MGKNWLRRLLGSIKETLAGFFFLLAVLAVVGSVLLAFVLVISAISEITGLPQLISYVILILCIVVVVLSRQLGKELLKGGNTADESCTSE